MSRPHPCIVRIRTFFFTMVQVSPFNLSTAKTTCEYLAGPNGGYEVAAVLENVEDLYDASRVAKNRNTGIRNGQVEGQVVSGLKRSSLSVENEEDDAVSKPGSPSCRERTVVAHFLIFIALLLNMKPSLHTGAFEEV